MCAVVTRVFSGIQPTGDMHLGNFIGAVRRWVDTQPPAGSAAARSHDAVFCVVDLHALTMPYDPAELTLATRRLATLLLASGLDPERCLLFVQSQVRAHAELTWLLNCTATFGELRRMTQFKDKATAREGSGGQESLSVGFFDYPVLMASDILLYDTDEVPVGDDQRQHVELTRDVAVRFNHQFGDVFKIPKATFAPFGARIMDLQNPTRKMSKSEDSPQGTIGVLEDAKSITKKIKSAVTDSDTHVRHDRDAKPGVSNLVEIQAAVTGSSVADIEKQFSDGGYGTFKVAVAEAVVEFLRPVQARYAELEADPGEVDRVLAVGAGVAASIADPVLARASTAAGLLPARRSKTQASARRVGRPRRRLLEVRRTRGRAVHFAEVFARHEQPAHRPVGRRCAQHDRLGVAPHEAHPEAEARVGVLLDRGVRHVGIAALGRVELVEIRGGLLQPRSRAHRVDVAACLVDPVVDPGRRPARRRVRPADPAEQHHQDHAERTDLEAPAATPGRRSAGRWPVPIVVAGVGRVPRRRRGRVEIHEVRSLRSVRHGPVSAIRAVRFN